MHIAIYVLVFSGYGAVCTPDHCVQEKREFFNGVYTSLSQEKQLQLRQQIDMALKKNSHNLCIENKDKSKTNKNSFFYNPNITQDLLVNIYINGEAKTKCTLQECKEFCEEMEVSPQRSEEHV